METQKFLEAFALSVQIAGTLIMALNSPKNIPVGAFMTSGTTTEAYSKPKRRNDYTRYGLILLCIGFALQLMFLILK